MSLSESEKQIVIDYLDKLDDVTKMIILASIEAFSQWLTNNLHSIYLKIKDAISQFWNWLSSISKSINLIFHVKSLVHGSNFD